jgi:hypothetical protein
LEFFVGFWKIFILVLRFFEEPVTRIFGKKHGFAEHWLGNAGLDFLHRNFCGTLSAVRFAFKMLRISKPTESYYLWVRHNLTEYPKLFEPPVTCKHWSEQMYLTLGLCGFGGLGVACWPLLPKFVGSKVHITLLGSPASL